MRGHFLSPMTKTNAMRLLESHGVAFQIREYEVNPKISRPKP